MYLLTLHYTHDHRIYNKGSSFHFYVSLPFESMSIDPHGDFPKLLDMDLLQIPKKSIQKCGTDMRIDSVTHEKNKIHPERNAAFHPTIFN